MEQIRILEKFQKSLVSFFDELIDMFPNEKDFILLRILVKDQIPSTKIMGYFEYDLKNPEIVEHIESRNDIFFLNNVLFSKINKSDVFKNIWTSKLDKDDKQMIWKWVDSFMGMTKEYTKFK